jgi:hypothetical protein
MGIAATTVGFSLLWIYRWLMTRRASFLRW